MRIVFVGASRLAIHTATLLLDKNHDVIIIERNKEKIESLASLGCGFIEGDGCKPQIMREADPADCDFLFCITGNDQTNIIASLLGRSLGFHHVVTCIDEAEFEHICIELGLENIIIPTSTISRYLAAIVQGDRRLSVSAKFKDNAALFSFVATAEDEIQIKELDLPDNCRFGFLYRDNQFMLADDNTKLKVNDECVIICHIDRLKKLRDRWTEFHTVKGDHDILSLHHVYDDQL